jgi:hypothetical protein
MCVVEGFSGVWLPKTAASDCPRGREKRIRPAMQRSIENAPNVFFSTSILVAGNRDGVVVPA